jgi:hypothetical protein
MAYDVIIVGARVAGATTALLLASEGLRVLLVDRAVFPSDTLSSHQLQPPGAERLARWGLLDEIVAAGTPATRKVRFDNNGVILHGNFPDEAALYSPRRTVLDRILVDSARMAGAEVHERPESVVGKRDPGRLPPKPPSSSEPTASTRWSPTSAEPAPTAAASLDRSRSTRTGRTSRWTAASWSPVTGGSSVPGRPTTG